MKLERINAAAQIELPKARPLNLSQRVSKSSALQPEKKRITETMAARTGRNVHAALLRRKGEWHWHLCQSGRPEADALSTLSAYLCGGVTDFAAQICDEKTEALIGT